VYPLLDDEAATFFQFLQEVKIVKPELKIIRNKSLLILGAGSSYPYGYPTGNKLREDICLTLNKKFNEFKEIIIENWGYPDGHMILESYERNMYNLSKIFSKSNIPSIDLFLKLNPKFGEIGKLGIILTMLSYEMECVDNGELFGDEVKSKDWYSYLYRRSVENINDAYAFENFKEVPLRIITFNYDRSFEDFFYNSFVSTFFEMNLNERFLNKKLIYRDYPLFNINHMYGQIAPLVWEDGGNNLAYKNKPKFFIKGLIDNIKVIGERTVPEEEKINELFNWADSIFFLGFGYHPENMKALNLLKNIQKKHLIYGTGIGLREMEISNVKQIFLEEYKKDYNQIYIENKDCLTLLRDYLY